MEIIILAKRSLTGIGTVRLACGMSLIVACILGVTGYFTNTLFVISIPFYQLTLTILGLAIINATAYSLFVFTITRSGPLFASQVGYLVTLSGILWGILLFGVNNSIWIWSSLAMMLLGLALV